MIDYKAFPTTRYQGSKRKIIPWLHSIFSQLDFDTALDVFGGSGTVSYLLKKMGKSVTYNDILKFNYIIGKSIIENNDGALTEEDMGYILQANDEYPKSSFIYDTFKDKYYLDNENIWLDNVIHNIETLSINDEKIINYSYKKCMAYNSLFQACLVKRPYNLFHRSNLAIRTTDVPRSFGNKTTWDTPFDVHFRKFAHEINNSIFYLNKSCKATNSSAFDIDMGVGYDLVYLDPPYLNVSRNNESSNYQHCYHFLEGIANYREWHTLIDYKSKNYSFHKMQENKFISKEILKTYESLFENFSKSIIVMSYKDNGTPSVDELVHLLSKFKTNVTVVGREYKYALQKKSKNNSISQEVVIIAS